MNFKTIIAIILIVLLVGGGMWETMFVDKTLTQLGSKVDAIMAQGEPYDEESIREMIEWWKGKYTKLALTVPHTPINEVSYALHELLGTVIADDSKSATAVLERLSGYAESLKDSYKFSAKHII